MIWRKNKGEKDNDTKNNLIRNIYLSSLSDAGWWEYKVSVHTQKRKIKRRRGRDGGREEDCWCPVCRAITHQKSPPSPPPWKNKTVSWHGGGGELQGGKLGNQMWSIKTYWHAEGLPLPHSHTKSTNSYSSPTCMCHTKAVRTTHTHKNAFAGSTKKKWSKSGDHVCTISHAKLH